MKPVVFLLFCLLHSVAFSQSALKKRFTLQAGTGAGLYLASTNQKADKDNNALAGHLGIGLTYQITQRLGIGVALWRNGFATDKDSNTTVSNGNFGLLVHYMVLGKEYSGLYVIGGLGGTALNYNNKNKKEEGNTSGAFTMLGLRYQRYFGENLGWYMEGGAAGYQYKKLEAKYADGSKSTNDRWEMGVTGMELRIGFLYTFGSKKE